MGPYDTSSRRTRTADPVRLSLRGHAPGTARERRALARERAPSASPAPGAASSVRRVLPLDPQRRGGRGESLLLGFLRRRRRRPDAAELHAEVVEALRELLQVLAERGGLVAHLLHRGLERGDAAHGRVRL